MFGKRKSAPTDSKQVHGKETDNTGLDVPEVRAVLDLLLGLPRHLHRTGLDGRSHNALAMLIYAGRKHTAEFQQHAEKPLWNSRREFKPLLEMTAHELCFWAHKAMASHSKAVGKHSDSAVHVRQSKHDNMLDWKV